MRYTYPQPANDDEFEDFCVRFYRHLLKRDGLVRYGKRGERQHGIDVIDQQRMSPLFAIQCKQRESTKTLRPKEIKDEVSDAETSPLQIDHYIIATTAKKSRHAQNAVLKLNERSKESRPFVVEIHFWEEICTYLNEFGRAIADFILSGERVLPRTGDDITSHLGAVSTSPIVADVDDSTSYAEIDKLLQDRKLEVAEHEITKLPDPERDTTLTDEQRHAVFRLKAKLALERGQFEEAARLFTLGYEACPGLLQSQQNRILAVELSGDHKRAFNETETLLNEAECSPVLVGLLIRNSRDANDLWPHQDKITEFGATDENVNLALVDKYLAWNQLESAEDAARKALAVAPRSAHAFFALGRVAHHLAFQGPWQDRVDRLAEATTYYSRAVSAAERDNYTALLPEIYTNRARVYGVLGKRDQAARDFQRAVQISDVASIYAVPAVRFLLSILDFASAQQLLPELDQESEEAAFLSTVIEFEFSQNDDDRRRHVLTMKGIADGSPDQAGEARFHCVQWAIELADIVLARDCVPESFVKQYPFQGYTLLAWIETEAGHEEQARQLADQAYDSTTRGADTQQISMLGRVLVRLGEHEKALPLFEHAATPGVFDDDCKRLLECAQQLGRDDVQLRICTELRQTRAHDSRVRELEVRLLSHYAPEQAFIQAKEYRASDGMFMLAASNYLAVRLGKLEEVALDADNLPAPDELEPEDAYIVVTTYIELERYWDALQFVYHQLRTHFSEDLAHGQYIAFMHQYGKRAGVPARLESVDSSSAVLLENLRTAKKRWFVIEGRGPDPARNEFSPSCSAAEMLVGKQVEDIVDLYSPSLQSQEEKLLEILPKYVYLYRDVLENFQHRFPASGAIQSFQVIGEDGSFDPLPMIESLRQRKHTSEGLTQLYLKSPCPLHIVASRLGTDVRRLMAALAKHEDWSLNCVRCPPREYSIAIDNNRDLNKIVLDLSAIVTISRLEAWEQFPAELKFYVSRTTYDEIAEWKRELETDTQPSGYSFLTEDGKVKFWTVTEEQIQSDRNEVEGILASVTDRCAIISSLAVSQLSRERREDYADVCGRGTLEALSAAKDNTASFWTDDIFIGIVAEGDFGLQRVWTQLVFGVLKNGGRITAETYSKITIQLAAWNYVNTIWFPEDVIAGGDLSEWDVNKWPLRQSIRLIGQCPIQYRGRIALDCIRLLRRSSCGELRQSAVIQAILSSVKSVSIVEWMLQNIDREFPIDIPFANFVRWELGYWLRGH